jgi:hypothetical protein
LPKERESFPQPLIFPAIIRSATRVECIMRFSASIAGIAAFLTATGVSAALAQTTPQTPNLAQAFKPAHGDLPRSAGVPAELANEKYVAALARIVYYWGYPAIDVTS